MIRIGSSCALSTAMAIGKVVETRLFIAGTQSQWEATAKKAIRDKQYLIVTPCINRNDGSGHYPNDTEWRNFISTTCVKLRSFGGNNLNSRISNVNEPMKFCSKEQYAHLVNLAYPIVKANGFKMGAGNEEFITAQAKGNMYQYILSNCQFDILDIHIQASCDTKAHTDQWINEVMSWKANWNKPVDCTESNYKNISDKDNYDLLVYQVEEAERRLNCPNFCMVFRRMDRSAFPASIQNIVQKWIDKGLCFEVIGEPGKTSPYVNGWDTLTNSKAPVPNIKKGVNDGMIIKTIGHKTNDVKSGYGVELLHELLLYHNYIEEDDIESMFVYDAETRKAVEQFQLDLNITKDGRVGRQTWRNFISSVDEADIKKDFQFNLEVVMSPYNKNGDT